MKKNHIVASLVAAGVLAAGLVVYKLHSTGTITLPASVTALIPGSAPPTPLKREFPSQSNDAPVVMDEPAAVVGEDASVAGVEPIPEGDSGLVQGDAPSVAAPAAGAAVPVAGDGQDVDSRITRAQALSAMLLNEAPKPSTAPASTAGKPGVAGTAAYAGEWSGEFIGPDAGTVAVSIAPDGTVSGQGMSTMTSIGFGITGKVTSSGQVEMTKATAGVTSTGAVFTGSLSAGGQGKGTWVIPNYDVSGTWRLSARPAQ
jgi:hypothetical protein